MQCNDIDGINASGRAPIIMQQASASARRQWPRRPRVVAASSGSLWPRRTRCGLVGLASLWPRRARPGRPSRPRPPASALGQREQIGCRDRLLAADRWRLGSEAITQTLADGALGMAAGGAVLASRRRHWHGWPPSRPGRRRRRGDGSAAYYLCRSRRYSLSGPRRQT